jgi:nicotinamide riboside transporter PnuC
VTWTWALVAMSLIGNVLVIRKRRSGFTWWAAVNLGWIAVDAQAGLWSQAALFVAYFGLAIIGWATWRD